MISINCFEMRWKLVSRVVVRFVLTNHQYATRLARSELGKAPGNPKSFCLAMSAVQSLQRLPTYTKTSFAGVCATCGRTYQVPTAKKSPAERPNYIAVQLSPARPRIHVIRSWLPPPQTHLIRVGVGWQWASPAVSKSHRSVLEDAEREKTALFFLLEYRVVVHPLKNRGHGTLLPAPTHVTTD